MGVEGVKGGMRTGEKGERVNGEGGSGGEDGGVGMRESEVGVGGEVRGNRQCLRVVWRLLDAVDSDV